MNETTDERIEHLKHQDFKNKKHEKGCTCGYCELKRWEEQQQQLKKEFDKRIRSLKLDFLEKDMLFDRFIRCWDAGFCCCYCKKRMDLKYENEYGWTIDHIIPRAKGGKDIVGNLCFCCRDCNFQKKAIDAEKYRADMEKIKQRKKKRELGKARKASKRDEQTREAYEQIFQHVKAKSKGQ